MRRPPSSRKRTLQHASAAAKNKELLPKNSGRHWNCEQEADPCARTPRSRAVESSQNIFEDVHLATVSVRSTHMGARGHH